MILSRDYGGHIFVKHWKFHYFVGFFRFGFKFEDNILDILNSLKKISFDK